MSDDWRIVVGDCRERLAEEPAESVDAVVCDPPYEIGFMGRSWDSSGVAFQPETWEAALRVLKPGGHLLAFGGSRTHHRIAVAIEDAGFEIRDTIMWMYGQGFPKSLNVSKQLDRAAGAEPEVVGEKVTGNARSGSAWRDGDAGGQVLVPDTRPTSEEGRRWEGWGTALKPGYEPIIMARKPPRQSIAASVTEHGTGAINVAGCRIATGDDLNGGAYSAERKPSESDWVKHGGTIHSSTGREYEAPAGRWPANVLLTHHLDCRPAGVRRVPSGTAVNRNYLEGERRGHEATSYEIKGRKAPDQTYAGEDGMETVPAWDCHPDCPIRLLDEQSGTLTSGANPTRRRSDKFRTAYGDFEGESECIPARGADSGGASRFFYCAKASRAERNAGLDHLPIAGRTDDGYGSIQTPNGEARSTPRENWNPREVRNPHPTVKPIDLMRWLIRLATPPGGTVLDPFLGSGTTGCAAALEGMAFIGIEREADYIAIAEARIAFWAAYEGVEQAADALASEALAKRHRDAGQLTLT